MLKNEVHVQLQHKQRPFSNEKNSLVYRRTIGSKFYPGGISSAYLSTTSQVPNDIPPSKTRTAIVKPQKNWVHT